jgi:hypothetical protein
MVETLVESGADLDAVDADGQSCLFYCAASGDIQLLQTLVEQFNMEVSQAVNRRKQTVASICGNGSKCGLYLQKCLKDPPLKNVNFVRKRKLAFSRHALGSSKRVEPKAVSTYLMKKSPSLLKGWQKRYFVMQAGMLTYYNNVSE